MTTTKENEYTEEDVKRMVEHLQKEYTQILAKKRSNEDRDWQEDEDERRDMSVENDRYHTRSRSRESRRPAGAREYPSRGLSPRTCNQQRSPSRGYRENFPRRDRGRERSRSRNMRRPPPVVQERGYQRPRPRSRSYPRPIRQRSRSYPRANRPRSRSYGRPNPRQRSRSRSRGRGPGGRRGRGRGRGQPYFPGRSRSRSPPRGPTVGAVRPLRGGPRKPGDWECPCGTQNFARRVLCFYCEMPRKQSAEEIRHEKASARDSPRRRSRPRSRERSQRWRGQPSLPGDWPCYRCGFNNFARRVQCFNCYHPKQPEQMTLEDGIKQEANNKTSTPTPPQGCKHINLGQRSVSPEPLDELISGGENSHVQRQGEVSVPHLGGGISIEGSGLTIAKPATPPQKGGGCTGTGAATGRTEYGLLVHPKPSLRNQEEGACKRRVSNSSRSDGASNKLQRSSYPAGKSYVRRRATPTGA